MRQIVQEHVVSEAIDQASAEFPRISDAISGLEWRLSHRPEDGIQRKSGFMVYRQSGFPTVDIPDITVLYTYDDNSVNVVRIRIDKSS